MVKDSKMPLDVFDNKGQTPFHHSLTKPNCLHLARWMLWHDKNLLNQEVRQKVLKQNRASFGEVPLVYFNAAML